MGDVVNDHARFEALHRATRVRLLGYLLRRTADPHDAADLLAETYTVAWRRRAVVPAGVDAELWLFGVARNLLANHRRRRRRDDVGVAALGAALRTAPSVVPPPDLVLDAALATLDDTDRELLTLTAWEGLTPAEIAYVIGVPAGTVRVRLHRARRRLHDLLDADDRPTAPPASDRPRLALDHQTG